MRRANEGWVGLQPPGTGAPPPYGASISVSFRPSVAPYLVLDLPFPRMRGPSCGGWNRGLEDRRPPFVPPGLTLACPSSGGVLLPPACLLLLFSGGSLLRGSSGFSARVYWGYFGHGKAGCAQSGGDIFVGGRAAHMLWTRGREPVWKWENQATDCLSFLSIIWAI